MATLPMDQRRLRLLQQRIFAYDMPGGIPSVPPSLREQCAAGWFFGQSLTDNGLMVLDDLHQGTPRPVQPGRCANFDGVDDYIDCGDVGDPGTGSQTVSAWIKYSGTAVQAVITKNDNAGGVDGRWGFYVEATTAKPYIFVYVNSLSSVTAKSTTGLNDGNWHLWTGVIDRTNGVLLLYVDSVQVASASLTGLAGQNIASSIPLRFGRDTVGNYFTGKIFDVRVYNRALTASEVSAIYNTSKPGGRPDVALYPSNLVGHWKLDDVGGGLARDSSGNGYNGTKAGTTYSTFHYQGADVPFSWENEVGNSLVITDLRALSDGEAATGITKTVLGNNRFTLTKSAGTARTWRQTYPLATLRDGRVDMQVTIESVTGTGNIFCDVSDGPISINATAAGTYVATNQGPSGPYDSTFRFFDIELGADITAVTLRIDKLDLVERLPQKSTVPSTDVLGNTLTYTGPVPRNAKLIDSFCGTFDGVDDVGTCAAAVSTVGGAVLSASAWVYRAASGAYQGIVGDWGNDGAKRWMLYVNSSNGIRARVSSGGTTSRARDTNGPIPLNEWTHVTMTFAAGEIKIYINGVEAATTLADSTVVTTIANVATVCRIGSSAVELLTGKLVDVRYYASELSAADVALLYAGKTITPQPVGHWPMQEGSGATLYDVSGNGLHATLTGATLSTFWGTRQSNVHRNIRRGFRMANANGTSRTFNGTNQYFSLADNASLSMGDVNCWFACAFKVASLPVGAVNLFAKFASTGDQREYRIYIQDNDATIVVTGDGITAVSANALNFIVAGEWAFVFGYHDPTANVIGIGGNGGALTTTAHTTGIFDGTSHLTVGARLAATGGLSPVEYLTGEISMVAIGKPSSQPASWSAIRDAIYNGGTPLTYSQLTSTQKTDWGLVSWWDCDEFADQLRDKHGTNHLTGSYMPRIPAKADGGAADGAAINRPSGVYHNDAETRIDFRGDTSASPWQEGLSPPSAYNFGDAVSGLMRKSTVVVEGQTRENNFYILKE